MSSQPTAYPYPSTMSVGIAGALTTSSIAKFVMPFAGRIASGAAAVTVAPVGASLLVQVKNASTVMGTYTIVAGASSVSTCAMSATEAYTKFAAGDVLSLTVTQVGSSTAGSNFEATLVVDQYNLDGVGSNEYSLTFRRGAHDGGVLTAANVNTYQENSSSSSTATGKLI